MKSKTRIDQEEDEGDKLELRADHVDEDVLRKDTVTADVFDGVHSALLARTMTLIVGPRGCGKTHMMRYTHLQCVEDSANPLSIYVSFNRYLRLEPLLIGRSDAGSLFHVWVLGRVLIALMEVVTRIRADQPFDLKAIVGLDLERVETLVARLERGLGLAIDEEDDSRSLSIEPVISAIRSACAFTSRKRAILLLDDAALTLTPEFMTEFFDVVRAIKKNDIAPKCSIYPGSTEYGPNFHAYHEAKILPVWLSIDNPQYLTLMGTIGEKRFADGISLVNEDVRKLLMYAAFGIPRAYLSLLRGIIANKGEASQAALNRVIQEHRDEKIAEYLSLEKKIPKFKTLVRTGEELFINSVNAVKAANETLADKNEKQLLIGISDKEFDSFKTRMTQFLIEAGLIYEHSEVSHGTDRKYRRFTPHVAALIAARAFAGRSRGTSPVAIVEFLQRAPTKHPVRRTLKTLLSKGALQGLKLDFPPCQQCHTPREKEDQKFCMECGVRLTDVSTFSRLMKEKVADLPNLTEFQKSSLEQQNIETIGDLLSVQDPGTKLRKTYGVGRSYAAKIINRIEEYVDEFLS